MLASLAPVLSKHKANLFVCGQFIKPVLPENSPNKKLNRNQSAEPKSPNLVEVNIEADSNEGAEDKTEYLLSDIKSANMSKDKEETTPLLSAKSPASAFENNPVEINITEFPDLSTGAKKRQ